MGNRAHVIFKNGTHISPAVYLHWNGGPNTVYAALREMDRRGVRKDANYQCARFIGIMHELFMPHQLSLGVINGPKAITPELLDEYDHGNNGVYVIETPEAKDFTDTKTLKLKVRRFSNKKEWTAAQVKKEYAAEGNESVGGSEAWLKNFPKSEEKSDMWGL